MWRLVYGGIECPRLWKCTCMIIRWILEAWRETDVSLENRVSTVELEPSDDHNRASGHSLYFVAGDVVVVTSQALSNFVRPLGLQRNVNESIVFWFVPAWSKQIRKEGIVLSQSLCSGHGVIEAFGGHLAACQGAG